MQWYNFIRPLEAFDIERFETPTIIYYKRLKRRSLSSHSLICWKGV
ncbi:MAG: hypothetical protein RXR30_01195 [Nitrososphaeria archaeon]